MTPTTPDLSPRGPVVKNPIYPPMDFVTLNDYNALRKVAEAALGVIEANRMMDDAEDSIAISDAGELGIRRIIALEEALKGFDR
jgi:hypothetical protein